MSSVETFDFAFTNWPETIPYLFLKDPSILSMRDHTLEIFIQNLGVFDNF